MPEMHLKQPGFTYSGCGPFAKSKDKTQNFMQKGHKDYIYRDDLNKACFQHDKSCGKYKYLTTRTESDKVLKGKVFKIASNPKYNAYERGLASMVYMIFDKKSTGGGIQCMSNQQLADELQKPIIRKFKRRKVYSYFKNNIW